MLSPHGGRRDQKGLDGRQHEIRHQDDVVLPQRLRVQLLIERLVQQHAFLRVRDEQEVGGHDQVFRKVEAHIGFARAVRQQLVTEPPEPTAEIDHDGAVDLFDQPGDELRPVVVQERVRMDDAVADPHAEGVADDWRCEPPRREGRDRRYGTCNNFASDLMHFLSNEPVEARPPSATYKLAKFARRHRTGA